MATIKQVARRLGVSESYARRLARQGKISAAKPGHDWDVKGTKNYRKKRK